MKTKIFRQGDFIALAAMEDAWDFSSGSILASMTLFEGTDLWMVKDLRLTQNAMPNLFSGRIMPDDLVAKIAVLHEVKADFVCSQLREFVMEKHPDGRIEINWSPLLGVVPGNHNGASFDLASTLTKIPLFHKQKEALDILKSIQKFWRHDFGTGNSFDGARIHPDYIQPKADSIYGAVVTKDFSREILAYEAMKKAMKNQEVQPRPRKPKL